MYPVNVGGTRALMLAALEAGVRRVVYTSSVATLATASDQPGDETRSASADDLIGPYKRSKFEAEAEVARLVRECGLPAVIVNPSTPMGPHDPTWTVVERMGSVVFWQAIDLLEYGNWHFGSGAIA
jgi:dihydroflavonol-4-reductase